MTTVAQVLRDAADLLESEGAWTRDVYARNASGHEVKPDDGAAVCWCLTGAVRRTAPSLAVWSRAIALLPMIKGRVWKWNDEPGRTQAEVVAALRKAADLQCKAEADAVPRSGGMKTNDR